MWKELTTLKTKKFILKKTKISLTYLLAITKGIEADRGFSVKGKIFFLISTLEFV